MCSPAAPDPDWSGSDDAELSPEKPAIPREYLGKARAFRTRLIASDMLAGPAMDKVVAPLRARAARGKPPRSETITDAVRAWRNMAGSFGRLALEIDAQKNSLHIRELRISAATNSFEEWSPGEVEPAIAVVITQFQADGETFWFRPVLLAGVSLHALGRRYQRSFDTSDESLKRDFIVLASASASDDLLGSRGEFRVPAAGGGGLWVGAATIAPEGTGKQRILSARSFITD